MLPKYLLPMRRPRCRVGVDELQGEREAQQDPGGMAQEIAPWLAGTFKGEGCDMS
jgi:hypothetical protein